MAARHAEVAGAGLIGLTAAALLARSGWSVRVHERAPDLREVGAGLFLFRNALAALDEASALEEATSSAERLTLWERFDERGRRTFHRAVDPAAHDHGAGPVVVRRADLHRTLVEASRRAGVEIITESEVIAADATGAVHLANGTTHRADLVVGADGVNSSIRRALGLQRSIVSLPWGGSRFLVPRQTDEEPGHAREHSRGSRVVGAVPCGETVYVYLGCRADDVVGRRVPLDREAWLGWFPHLGGVFERLDADPHWAELVRLRCSAWSAGRVVLLGDAAHAMPPQLSQGACLGMANARSLTHALDLFDDIPAALEEWEAAERPITELTQRWATRFARIAGQWPQPLLGLRSLMLRAADRSRYVRSQTGLAAAHESRFVRASRGAAAPPRLERHDRTVS